MTIEPPLTPDALYSESVNIVDALNRTPLTHLLLDRPRVRNAANAVLRVAPLVRTLPRTRIRYRCRYVDSIALADQLFHQGIYDRALPLDLETFADLGCNVGHFVALLVERTGKRDVRGIAIDADRDMVRETSWLVAENELDGVVPIVGLVGTPGKNGIGEFHVHQVTLRSSRFTVAEPGQREGGWKTRRVQYVDVDALWRAVVGDVPCDLLKIDIEGSETDFVNEENPLLRRARRVLIECHRWVVAPEVIDARLRAIGFSHRETLHEAETARVAFYDRTV
jgi:FkbM family methyltransferase